MRRLLIILGMLVTMLFSVSYAFALPTLTYCRINYFEFQDWEVVWRDGEIVEPGTVLVEGDIVEGVADLTEVWVGPTKTYDPAADESAEVTAYFYGLVFEDQDVDASDPDNIQLTTYWNTDDAYLEVYWDGDDDLDLSLDLDTAISTASDGTKLLQLQWEEYTSFTNAGDVIADPTDDATNVISFLTLEDDSDWLWNDTDLWDMELYNGLFSDGPYPFKMVCDVYGLGSEEFPDMLIDVPWMTYNTSDDVRGHPVPEPATMLLLGSGLLGVGIFGRKKTKKKS